MRNIEDDITKHLKESEEMDSEEISMDGAGVTDGSIETLMSTLLGITTHLKVFHWVASVHAEHVILGDLYDALDGIVDKIIENVLSNRNSIVVRSTSTENPVSIEVGQYGGLETSCNYLESIRHVIRDMDQLGQTTELSSLRDELLESIGSSIYLLGIVFNDRANPDQDFNETEPPTEEEPPMEEFSEEETGMFESSDSRNLPSREELKSKFDPQELQKQLGIVLLNDYQPPIDSTDDPSSID